MPAVCDYINSEISALTLICGFLVLAAIGKTIEIYLKKKEKKNATTSRN